MLNQKKIQQLQKQVTRGYDSPNSRLRLEARWAAEDLTRAGVAVFESPKGFVTGGTVIGTVQSDGTIKSL